METTSRHQCLIYEGPPSIKLPMLAVMLQQKLEEGYKCLYLNSPAMVAGMRACLAAMGIDVANEIAHDRLALSSDPVTTSKGFDVEGMLAKLEVELDQALSDGFKGMWATGDMTWEFGPEKNFEKLLEYELKLEEMFRRRPELAGICQYHTDTMPRDAVRHGLLTHRSVFVNETLSRINPHFLQPGHSHEHRASNPELDKMIAELISVPIRRDN